MTAALFDLQGRTAVVTGASRGIGAAIAQALLQAGADVITLQRSAASEYVSQTARAYGRSLQSIEMALDEAASIDAAIQTATALAPVDILVNNAGTQIRHAAIDFPLQDFDTVMAVNTRAVFQLSTGFARAMIERGHGKIINIASLLSLQGGLRVPAYAASKGAVAQLTKAFANEWASRGLNVNAIVPGYIDTDMNTALRSDAVRDEQILSRIPSGRWGRPEDLGGAAVFLASAASDYVNGILLPIDGGWLGR